MFTIISGTNRVGSNTYKVAALYQRLLNDKGVETNLLSLEGVNTLEKEGAMKEILENILVPSTKFIFVSPEYNGSIPGVLKALIDHSDVKRAWWHKKAMLAGVSTGRAGNLRGMDHLSAILNHIKINVLPNQLPISMVDKLMDADGQITHEPTLAAIDNQLNEFILF
jgi:chromate reductase, NAD(P)H dehydrogenase (quinone)